MNNRHVIRYFSDWYADRLRANDRKRVSEHLDECGRCRRYFQKMAEILNKPNVNELPSLKEDPWLAVKVRRIVTSKAPVARGIRPLRRFEWTLVGFVSTFLICVGLYIGSGVSPSASTTTTTDTISAVSDTTQTNSVANAYYQAFSQNDVASQWMSVLENN